MCRLFGFRSIIKSQVHRSLISCENALVDQSQRHPDGWGVAYFARGVPHIVKSAQTAIEDSLFQRVSGIVSSETVIAHLRRATVGKPSMINSHPFQYGHWVFAHNGEIPGFNDYRDEFVAQIEPEFRKFILGDTDSEVLFYLMLSRMEQHLDLENPRAGLEDLVTAVDETIHQIHDIRGKAFYERPDDDEDFDPVNLSFVITNGQMMVGHQGGKQMYYSTHKTRCPERDSCSSYSPVCEQPVDSGLVSHLLLSSEPLSGHNVWNEMELGEMVAVDESMSFRKYNSQRSGAPMKATALAE